MALRRAAVEIDGHILHVCCKEHADSHFISLTSGREHGSIVVASVDKSRFAAAGDDEINRGAAVEVSTLLGRKDDPVATVVARRLAATLAAAGDFRGITATVRLPDVEDKRSITISAIAAVLEVLSMPPRG